MEQLEQRITTMVHILCKKMNLDKTKFELEFDRYDEYPAAAGLSVPKDGSKRSLIFNLHHILKSEYSIATIVAHEMVHVQQYQLGKSEVKDRKMYWMGEDMTSRINHLMFMVQFGIIDRKEYMSLPWEAEAFAMQEEVAKLIEEEHV